MEQKRGFVKLEDLKEKGSTIRINLNIREKNEDKKGKKKKHIQFWIKGTLSLVDVKEEACGMLMRMHLSLCLVYYRL